MLTQFYTFLIVHLHALALRIFRTGVTRRSKRTAKADNPAPCAEPQFVIGERVFSARERLRQTAPVTEMVSISLSELRRMLSILGGTGTGKTSLIVRLVDAIVSAGRSLAIIDYRGDLLDRILVRLSARYSSDEMADRLLIIDLRSGGNQADTHTVSFNPLTQGSINPYTRAFFLLDIFDQLLEGGLGVQTGETLRNCLLALAMTGGSLLDIEPLLTDAAARAAILAGVDDLGVRKFFRRFQVLTDSQRSLWVSPILNKVSAWVATPRLKLFFGGNPSVSIQEFLDRRPDGILLFCAGADELFGTGANLVANLLVNAVATAVMRVDRPSRHDVLMVVDEFQNLVSDKFAEVLSEGRRFFLSLALSHQSTSQVKPKIRVLIRNIVATSIYFAVGGSDADLLADEIGSTEPKAVWRNILLNQKVGEATLVRRGQETVRVKTLYSPDPDVAPDVVAALRAASLRRHGRPRAEVEAEIRAREEAYFQADTGSGSSKQSESKPSAAQRETEGRRRRRAPRLSPQDYEVEE